MSIKNLIYQNLDILFRKQSDKPEGLNMQSAIEIGAYVAAGVLRSRYKQEKTILAEEIDGVYKIVGGFFTENFNSFSQADFDDLKESSLGLLQDPAFDNNLDTFIQTIVGE